MTLGIGLDLGFAHATGYCWFRDDNPVNAGIIKAAPNEDFVSMTLKVETLLTEHRPQWAAIEGVYLGKNANTLIELAFLGGAVFYIARKLECAVFRLSTYEIDEACGVPHFVKRAARKRHTREFAQRLGFDLPEDAADALAVGFAGWGEYKKNQWLGSEQ